MRYVWSARYVRDDDAVTKFLAENNYPFVVRSVITKWMNGMSVVVTDKIAFDAWKVDHEVFHRYWTITSCSKQYCMEYYRENTPKYLGAMKQVKKSEIPEVTRDTGEVFVLTWENELDSKYSMQWVPVMYNPNPLVSESWKKTRLTKYPSGTKSGRLEARSDAYFNGLKPVDRPWPLPANPNDSFDEFMRKQQKTAARQTYEASIEAMNAAWLKYRKFTGE